MAHERELTQEKLLQLQLAQAQKSIAEAQLGGIIAGQMQKQNELPAYLRDMASHDAARGRASAADFLQQYAKATYNVVVPDTSGICDICDEHADKRQTYCPKGDIVLKVCSTCTRHLNTTPTEVTTRKSRSLEKLREVKLYQISYVVATLILLYFFMS